MSAVMEHFPKHPFLTFFQNAFTIISVFSIAFCLYSVVCLYWIRPDEMNVEFTRMSAIILGIAFVIACPIAVFLTKKGRKMVAKERQQRKAKYNVLKKEKEL